MPNLSVALIFPKIMDNNFTSGGEKINYHILKVLYELGYKKDLYTNECLLDDTSMLSNIFVNKISEFYKNENKYLFSFGYNAFNPTTFSFIHENTQYYKTKYTRSIFDKILTKIFSRKHYIEKQNVLTTQIATANDIDTFIVPSNFIKEDILESYGKQTNKVEVLPLFINSEEIGNFKKEKNKVFTFGLVGRGFANKGGYEFLISIIILNLLGINCNALIIYPFSTSVTKLQFILNFLGFKNKINFLDYCSDMNPFYSQIDCLVMASKREAFGLVCLEAIARNIPTIINTRCGIKDFIKNNENGFVYDYKKPIINLIKTMHFVAQKKETVLLDNITNNAHTLADNLNYHNFKAGLKKIIETHKKFW